MADGPKRPFSAEIGVSAKVELKSEVPAESSGRALDALIDLIRPISESFGYLGDKVRLAREKTLFEIAHRVRERLVLSNVETKPIENKFLIPLLEKASLEDASNEKLIEMWANLLATAATDRVELLGQYVSVLSELTSDQARLLDKILEIDAVTGVTAGHFVDNYYYFNQTGLPGSLSEFATAKNADEFAEKAIEMLAMAGIAIDTLCVYGDAGDETTVAAPDGVYSDLLFYDFENLCRLGLLERIEIKRYKVGIYDIDLHYYLVTPVGIDLYACCNPTKLQRETRERLSGPSDNMPNVQSDS